jgi:2-methylcitrate dehydratase PrpD
MNTLLTKEIAEYAASTSYSSLPKEAIEQAKKVIFDEIACASFGRRSVAGGLTARYVRSLNTPSEAQIFGTNQRVSAAFAAMANGAAGHGEEVDGAHPAGGHPGASIVHAAMATGEMLRATGADLVNAVVIGYEVGVRLRWACGGSFGARRRLHLHADFLYALGSAVASSRLLGLDPTRICHALALSTFQANGLYATYAEHRHISKSFCEGQYAYAGVSAALMSTLGLEGHEDIIGAPSGLLDAWGEEQGRNLMVEGLGQDYSIMGASFKFFNAGYPIHSSLEAALSLVHDHKIDIDTIDHVTVTMNDNARRIVDNRSMHNICLQDMLAANLVRGGLKLDDEPFPGILTDSSYQDLRQRISVESDPAFVDSDVSRLGAKVTIVTRDGNKLSASVRHPRGYDSQGRIGWNDLEEKWAGNVKGCDLQSAITLAKNLEDVEDVTLLARMFGAPNC